MSNKIIHTLSIVKKGSLGPPPKTPPPSIDISKEIWEIFNGFSFKIDKYLAIIGSTTNGNYSYSSIIKPAPDSCPKITTTMKRKFKSVIPTISEQKAAYVYTCHDGGAVAFKYIETGQTKNEGGKCPPDDEYAEEIPPSTDESPTIEGQTGSFGLGSIRYIDYDNNIIWPQPVVGGYELGRGKDNACDDPKNIHNFSINLFGKTIPVHKCKDEYETLVINISVSSGSTLSPTN